MKLTVETLNAKVRKTIRLDVELDYEIIYVKFLIYDQTHTPVYNQMLLADGQVLCDSSRLIDCDFIRDRTIQLLLIDEYKEKFLDRNSFKVIVRNLVGKNFEVNVRPEDQVEDLKVKLQHEEDFPLYKLRLIFAGKMMEDNLPLSSYGFKEDSVIHALVGFGAPIPSYHLQFRTLTGKKITMTGRNETVKTVIERVWRREGIRAGNELIFNNEPLDNERRITTIIDQYYEKYYADAYKFEPDSILEFRDKSSIRSKDELKVYVKFPGSKARKALALIVKAFHSVRSLKSAIESKTGGRVENLKLLAGEDRELEDNRMLSDYPVRNETVLHATLKLKMFVKRLDDGTIFRLEVQSDDRIESIKKRVQHQERLPTDVQTLSLGTRRLEDDELVDALEPLYFEGRSIPPVLGLEVKLVRDLQVHISAHPLLRDCGLRRPISLSIKSNETIGIVKSRISSEVHHWPDQQHLYFNGEQLVDSCTFDQLGVQDRVGLSFAPRSKAFKISIVPIGDRRSRFESEVDAHDTIKYLKSLIEKRSIYWTCSSISDFPSDRLILIHGGRLLEDDRTLLNSGIGSGSELSVSLKVVELEVTVQTEFVERQVLKVRSDCAWEMFESEVKKLGLSICSENRCFFVEKYKNPKNLSGLIVRDPVMIKQTKFCNNCEGCTRIQTFKQVTGLNSE